MSNFKIQGRPGSPCPPFRRPWCHCIFKTFHRCFVNIYWGGFKSPARNGELKSMSFVHIVTSILGCRFVFLFQLYKHCTSVRSFFFPINDSFIYIKRAPSKFQPRAPYNLNPPWCACLPNFTTLEWIDQQLFAKTKMGYISLPSDLNAIIGITSYHCVILKMVILHDAIKTIQNRVCFFFWKKSKTCFFSKKWRKKD